MSFGFLTESALLPAKSKPIHVDSRSLVDLKAVVYEKEQKVKVDGRGGFSGGGLRALRGKRGKSGEAGGGSARKDPFAKKNRGVEDRSHRDELERVTESSKKKAAERRLAAKSSLYEKMAKGEVDSSRAESLVDFSRKTGSDLALLDARREKRGRDRDGTRQDGDDNYEVEDIDGVEVTIVDEFGRDRSVTRGSAVHRVYLEAKRATKEREAQEQAESESYDERYSYRGNKGTAAPAPVGSAGKWAWSSGTGRGADEGDFETREGQDRRANKKMKKLLEEEGGFEKVTEESGAKILSQWEKTLTGDQKSFLREVQEETEAKRKKSHTNRSKQRAERKELLRRKQQEARAARSPRDA